MIPFFPKPYPDELFYSVLARYCQQSALIRDHHAIQQIIECKNRKFSTQFMEQTTPEGFEACTRFKSIQSYVLDHSMFPFYTRFLPPQRRRELLRRTIEEGQIKGNVLPCSPFGSEGTEYLMYCPLCAKEDREQYGETYWHRIHQIPLIGVCAKHGCRLFASPIESKNNYHAIPAELTVSTKEAVPGTKGKFAFATLLAASLEEEFNLESEYQIKDNLQQAAKNCGYVYQACEVRKLTQMFEDFCLFCEINQIQRVGIQDEMQVSILFTGKKKNTYDICEFACFLYLNAEELFRNIPRHTSNIAEEILAFVRAGKSYCETARILSVSPEVVMRVCQQNNVKSKYRRTSVKEQKADMEKRVTSERLFWKQAVKDYPGYCLTQLRKISKEYASRLRWLRENDREWTSKHFPSKKLGKRKTDWIGEDKKLLPTVKKAVQAALKEDKGYPARITYRSISIATGISKLHLEMNLPLCKIEIEKHRISREQWQIRRLEWAFKVLHEEHRNFTLTAVCRKSNLHPERIQKLRPVICQSCSEEIIEWTKRVLDKWTKRVLDK